MVSSHVQLSIDTSMQKQPPEPGRNQKKQQQPKLPDLYDWFIQQLRKSFLNVL